MAPAGLAEQTVREPVASAHASKNEYFPALTGLRFILAVWVILDHITGKGMMLDQWKLSLPTLARQLFSDGYLAVQTFFILSGFVLAQSYARTQWNRHSLIRFGMARIARIYPIYLLSLFVVSRFMMETLLKPTRTLGQKAALLGDYVFVLLGWLGSLSVGWNTPAWSLSCELFFYLCFPLLFLWMRNAGLRRLWTALAVSIAVPIALQHAGVPAQWKPIHHLSDFLAGIAAAGLYAKIRQSGFSFAGKGMLFYVPAMLGGALLIAYPHCLDGTLADRNTALRPLNVLAILGLALSGGTVARVFSTRPIEYLGKVSYSMYILHVPILWWYTRYAFHLRGTAPYLGTATVYLSIVILLSIAAFELVESPANRWLRDWTAARLRHPAPAHETSPAALVPESAVA